MRSKSVSKFPLFLPKEIYQNFKTQIPFAYFHIDQEGMVGKVTLIRSEFKFPSNFPKIKKDHALSGFKNDAFEMIRQNYPSWIKGAKVSKETNYSLYFSYE